MIKINAFSISPAGSSFFFAGNDYENELTVITSPGDGKTDLIAIAADMGSEEIKIIANMSNLNTSDIERVINEVLDSWKAVNDSTRAEAVAAFIESF